MRYLVQRLHKLTIKFSIGDTIGDTRDFSRFQHERQTMSSNTSIAALRNHFALRRTSDTARSVMGAHEDDDELDFVSHLSGSRRGAGEDVPSAKTAETGIATSSTSMRDGSTVFGGSASEIGTVSGDRSVFRLARRHIKPGWPFRITTALCSERKLLVFMLTHFVATMVI